MLVKLSLHMILASEGKGNFVLWELFIHFKHLI